MTLLKTTFFLTRFFWVLKTPKTVPSFFGLFSSISMIFDQKFRFFRFPRPPKNMTNKWYRPKISMATPYAFFPKFSHLSKNPVSVSFSKISTNLKLKSFPLFLGFFLRNSLFLIKNSIFRDFGHFTKSWKTREMICRKRLNFDPFFVIFIFTFTFSHKKTTNL